MTGPIPLELLDRLARTQAALDRLVEEAMAEGFEVEIYARHDDGAVRYPVALVRRIYAPAPSTPNLQVIE